MAIYNILVKNSLGHPIKSGFVFIFNDDGATLSEIKNLAGHPIKNPLRTDANGILSFQSNTAAILKPQYASDPSWLETPNLTIPPGGSGATGGGSGNQQLYDHVLTPLEIADKAMNLPSTPASVVHISLYGGIEQRQNVDFIVNGNVLSWDTLAMQLLVESGSVMSINYLGA